MIVLFIVGWLLCGALGSCIFINDLIECGFNVYTSDLLYASFLSLFGPPVLLVATIIWICDWSTRQEIKPRSERKIWFKGKR